MLYVLFALCFIIWQQHGNEWYVQNFYPLGRILQTVTFEAPQALKPGPLTTVKVLQQISKAGIRHLEVRQMVPQSAHPGC